MLQRRFVVSGDKSKVAAIVLGRDEAEVPSMQPHQHRRRADRLGDVGSRRAGIKRDLLAQLPFVVPPGLRRRRQQNDHGGRGE
jgi:hypothetical protein